MRCACGAHNLVTAGPERSPYRVPARVAVGTSSETADHAGTNDACPRCQGALHPQEMRSGRPALGCTACGGTFLDHETFRAEMTDALQRQAAAQGPKPARQSPRESSVRYVKCPHCQQLMNRLNFGKTSGILVDACKAHGTWFDRGELDDIVAAVEHGAVATDLAKLGTLPAPKAAPTDADKMLAVAAVGLDVERARTERRIDQAVTVLSVADDLLWLVARGWF